MTRKVTPLRFIFFHGAAIITIKVKLYWYCRLAATFECLKMKLFRARTYGWQDTYVFTKAMAEMLIANGRGHLPIVIVHPSVIESTYSQPFPGWI